MKADLKRLAGFGQQALSCYLCKRLFNEGEDIASYTHSNNKREFRHLDCQRALKKTGVKVK